MEQNGIEYVICHCLDWTKIKWNEIKPNEMYSLQFMHSYPNKANKLQRVV